MPYGENLTNFGRSGATLALHLAVNRIEQVVDEIGPLYGTDCPVAVVAQASPPEQKVLRGTLADIVAQVREAGIKRAAVIFVGEVERCTHRAGAAPLLFHGGRFYTEHPL